MFMEALADAGVLQGLSRELSYNLAAHTMIGAAKMVLETKKHPAGLKDDVCSPSGCTINAMYHLEKNGFRSLLMDAVGVATEIARKDEQ
ncbi:pyrroline-5-carboxylate reductase 1, mitochondrial-like protein [Euroglyphus maynei]|uniref:Pyrroline-5-carboxylate reductase 1, mitochondrial-like protein n=1 Tax=Euroglyphus maynei TaxID=6958 RepID=A0A1Y3AU71_EURMA|nr:pyrroline-5-carboxylate reductase 1, mitochondrial-like protein [Euroglyphus maynei]